MDKQYRPQEFEAKIYQSWEKAGAFKPTDKGKPFTIVMPPPNANASLHAGHGMYTVDDVLIRLKRMQGFSAAWLPGMDHAGFETQYVFEKELQKKGQSRLDFDRETLYQKVFDFVKTNSGLIYEQFKRLGFSADWDKSVFSLDDHVLDRVFTTFVKMEKEKYVYRDNYLVNYCTHCGTSLADLEVIHLDRVDPLYYVRYPFANKEGYVVVATVRPEPIFVDTHLAVNPKDKKNKHLIGQKVKNPLTGEAMEIIGEDYVDPDFGTGVVKLTPAHDPNDFEVAKKKGLPVVTAVDVLGKITANGGKYAGLKVKIARETVVADLKEKDLIEKIDENYNHAVTVCYKCKRDLEPMVIPNWFIRVAELKKLVIEAVTKDQVKFYPKRFKKQMLNWLNIMHDWPISRQIAWGIRIPAWYDVAKNPDLQVVFLDKKGQNVRGKVGQLLKKYSFQEMASGLQSLTASQDAVYVISKQKPAGDCLQETDTFDTWFSSGQWPLVTATEPSRFPTNVMGTLADILRFWVSRMIMFSLYLTKDVPFKKVYLWSMVADAKGQKMSKSKGNVVNPIDLVEKYGADALRMALLFGTSAGSKVILAEDKVRGMRNLTNKIWNATRYVLMSQKGLPQKGVAGDKKFLKETDVIAKKVTQQLENLKIGLAAETAYDKFWHWFCDQKIEEAKAGKISYPALLTGLRVFLKLLHPFVPFVTEAVWQQLPKSSEKLLINASWPTPSQNTLKS